MITVRRALVAILTIVTCASAIAAVPEPMAGSSVSGFVEDSVTKETLIGATVLVKGTKLGAYTNKRGFFSISNVPPGKQTLTVTSIGYEKRELEVIIKEDEPLKLRIQMSMSALSSRDVVVEASRDDEKRQINISKVNVPMEQIQQMRIGGEADIFRALQMLPGVLTSSQISSGLFIRGGSPDQNLVLLDGMTVYNPSHLFGFISAFNTDAVKDVELLKGGFPAEFGGRMSAVLNVTQKDGNRDHVEGLVGLGLISSRASVQGPLGNGSFFLGGRRTYLDLIVGLIPDDPENPLPDFNFYDVNAKITQDLGPNDKLSMSGFLTRDALSYTQQGLDFSIGIGNKAGALQWSHVFGDDLFSIVTLSASTYDNGFDGNNAGFIIDVGNAITDYSAKVNLEWFANDRLTVKTGYEGTLYNFTYEQNFSGSRNPQSSDAVFNLNVWDNIHSVYGSMNYLITDEISFQAGLRGNYWTTSKHVTVDPRLALRVQVTDGIAIKGAWGIFHQYLRLASNPDFTFFDTWLPTDRTVPPGRSDHYVLAVETQPWDGVMFSVDAYYKTLHNINELNQTQTRAREVGSVFYIGAGTAYGVEFFLQQKVGKLTGWVGYALGWVEGRFDSVNFGRPFRPKFDRRHDFKATALYKLNERWDIGATFVFQTGQSYTGATSRYQGTLPGFETGRGIIVPSQRWGLRLPSSHQLNLNVNYNTTLFDLPFTIFLDIYNVYSRRDIWFRFYDLNEQIPEVTDVRLLPILPTISFEIKF